MEKAHLILANSTPMMILCAIALFGVLWQPVLFFIRSWKRGKQIGMTEEEMKKITKVSSVFTIIPTLPVLISYLVLVPSLGRWYPWLRLSVVGAAGYEAMAADMAARGFGYEEGIAVASFSDEAFIVIMLVMAVAILGGNLFNMFFLKTYDMKVKELQSSGSVLVPILTTAMFLGMYGVMSAPYLTNVDNPTNITTLLISSAVAILMGGAAKKNKKLKELVFPASLLAGMASACIIAPML